LLLAFGAHILLVFHGVNLALLPRAESGVRFERDLFYAANLVLQEIDKVQQYLFSHAD